VEIFAVKVLEFVENVGSHPGVAGLLTNEVGDFESFR
jgi:hypothetical protein